MTAARPDLAVASAASKASRSLRSDSPALSDAYALTQIRAESNAAAKRLDSAEGFELALQNCALDRDDRLNTPHSSWLCSAQQTFWKD